MVGYRAWLVDTHPPPRGGPHLASLFTHHPSNPGERLIWGSPGPTRASCWITWPIDPIITRGLVCKPCPGPECLCGLWSTKTLDELVRYLPDSGVLGTLAVRTTIKLVIGTVKIWGQVIEHVKGLRSEFAQVDSLLGVTFPGDRSSWFLASDKILLELAVRYDVPFKRIAIWPDGEMDHLSDSSKPSDPKPSDGKTICCLTFRTR
jgi:hypothetical protein